eukprot:4571-Eustigmatos_ZCMA.PRE.1
MATSDITSNLLKVISKSFDLVKGELTLTLVSDPSSMLGKTSQSAKLLYSTTNSKVSRGSTFQLEVNATLSLLFDSME